MWLEQYTMHFFIFVEKTKRTRMFQRAELRGRWAQEWLIVEEIEIIGSLAEGLQLAIITEKEQLRWNKRNRMEGGEGNSSNGATEE